ncbi:uracil phosphoribosyltransferase-domain-containing protein [Xylariaceae sp. FL1272]|nr:uracil phosphoribosyltransferase-domain-containing protein [Xylariaceae sp. FL1272]
MADGSDSSTGFVPILEEHAPLLEAAAPATRVTPVIRELGSEHFLFYEGSQVIASLAPGGLDGFQKLPEQDQKLWRQCAIDRIRKDCLDTRKLGVVTGHFMFWAQGEQMGQSVCTPQDLGTYTHILYLNPPAETISQRRHNDVQRARPFASSSHLREWQVAEETQLRRLCLDYGILFHCLSTQPTLVTRASAVLRDWRHHTEAQNLSRAEHRLDEVLLSCGALRTMLVLDADKTLAAEDTGELFWASVTPGQSNASHLRTLFSSPLGYSYTAFRQAMLMYETIADEEVFDAVCANVALGVTMHSEFLSLLRLVAQQDHVGAVVVTCGLRRVWDKILERHGLSGTVQVIGGGRIADGFVVTAAVKASIVSRLRDVHRLYVIAFGDSPLDLPMLRAADQAIVVVGEEGTRSKTMDAALESAMEDDGLRASQALLPSHVPPRLSVANLPVIRLDEPEFVKSILCRDRCRLPAHQVLDATGKSATKLLMTPTRDAEIDGLNLRAAHRRIGWYLAIEFLAQVMGLEEYSIPHVQGHKTNGFQLRDERRTSIIALMRGGEPMAFGVGDALPNAMFVHARGPEDVLGHHLNGRTTAILVDSVVNSGKTVVQFVHHIRKTRPDIRIVVVAGVTQKQCVSEGSLAHMFADDGNLKLITLRLSDNKFTGKGSTDTGNRLFNTTSLQ